MNSLCFQLTHVVPNSLLVFCRFHSEVEKVNHILMKHELKKNRDEISYRGLTMNLRRGKREHERRFAFIIRNQNYNCCEHFDPSFFLPPNLHVSVVTIDFARPH